MKTLYARAIWLRNCGRFTHVSSDFGSQYRTHTFITSEALYASLTREVTWRHRGRFIDLEEDALKATGADYFVCDYDVAKKPLWFTPGLFVDRQGQPLAKQRGVADTNDFNVIDEGHPGTGGSGRPSYVPTYGRIEGILPDHLLLINAFSPSRAEVECFKVDQTFLMGKKRTMFQIVNLSAMVEGTWEQGECRTGWLELPPNYGTRFQRFEILAATMRYIILRGMTRDKVRYVEFSFPDGGLRLPDFYLEGIPMKVASTSD
ncbi:MAG: hypothetical protein JW892_09745 [Anaerolineae bacterium]|nr:hypothetical protein [Anaerolineae bacterium]